MNGLEIGTVRTAAIPFADREDLRAVRKPDFFMVGAPKSGTSSLYYYLTQHPDIFMSYPKEPHFFYNRESPGAPVLGSKDLKEYLSLFEGVPESKQAGEASTSYLWLANAASEIKQLCPQAKIIILLRNPVDRAYSHFWHGVRHGDNILSFEEALAAEPERIHKKEWHGLYYVECGRYAEQVSRYLETFGRESVRVYLFEDLIYNARWVCRDAFEFLGVDPEVEVEVGRVYNAGGVPKSRLFAKLIRLRIKELLKKGLPETTRRNLVEWVKNVNNKPIPEMAPETRARLKAVFHEDVVRLEKMIECDLSHWRE